MNHESNIFFVYAHAESYSGNYDLNFSIHPLRLNLLSLTVGQISMVVITCDLMVDFKILAKLFTFISTEAVNYAALLFKAILQKVDQMLVPGFYFFAVYDFISEVWSVER